MKISMKKNKINMEIVDLISNNFIKGKVVVYPTDTIYGLGCTAINLKAIKKIMKMKKIRQPRSFIVLVDSFKMIKKYCYLSKMQEQFIANNQKTGNKPITFILKSRNKLPREVQSQNGTLAVRLPNSDFLIKIISRVKVPILSTSLNITGKEPVNNLKGIEDYFKKEKPDLVIDAGIMKRKKVSQIIDIINLKPDGSGIKILR